jgi:nucleoid DNA-binding protein
MRAIGKKDIAEGIAKDTGLSRALVRDIMDRFIEQVKKHFKNGDVVEIHWFGTFHPHFKKERSYKVPKTGEIRTMPARITLRFKTSKHMYIYKEKNK